MRSIRLFVDAPLAPGHAVALPATTVAHALRALRLQTGDPLILFNGNGNEYAAHLTTANARAASAQIESATSPQRESPLALTLIQALARGEKMDWIVQKATELGVTRIVPVATARSEVKLDAARSAKRLEHWRAIAIAACEQCGRNTLPQIDAVGGLTDWLEANSTRNADQRWMLCPGDGARPRELSPRESALTLAVGPEGGFGDDDLTSLRLHGFQTMALGPRILRTETAGIAALAALQAVHGDL